MANTITIIQGDDWQGNLVVKNLNDETVVDSMYLTCAALRLTEPLTYDEEEQRGIVKLDAARTAQFREISTSYDITIKFKNEKIKTIILNGKFVVVRKVNKVEPYFKLLDDKSEG